MAQHRCGSHCTARTQPWHGSASYLAQGQVSRPCVRKRVLSSCSHSSSAFPRSATTHSRSSSLSYNMSCLPINLRSPLRKFRWSGRSAESYPHTGYEPNDQLINQFTSAGTELARTAPTTLEPFAASNAPPHHRLIFIPCTTSPARANPRLRPSFG